MSSTRDVTTCADMVYGKHFSTCTHLSQIRLVSAKNDFSGARTWTHVTQERYIMLSLSDFTFA